MENTYLDQQIRSMIEASIPPESAIFKMAINTALVLIKQEAEREAAEREAAEGDMERDFQ